MSVGPREVSVVIDAVARFMANVRVEDGDRGCWLWLGAIDRHGYGLFPLGGKMLLAHRWSFEQFVGSIPEGLELDHFKVNSDRYSCSRSCCNWAHLEPVTRKENLRRSPVVRSNGRALGLSRRRSDLPEGLSYLSGGRSVKAEIHDPATGRMKYLGCRTPASSENVVELAAIYQAAREASNLVQWKAPR